jgi:hypothetical protein
VQQKDGDLVLNPCPPRKDASHENGQLGLVGRLIEMQRYGWLLAQI